jgi:hypothetical protein
MRRGTLVPPGRQASRDGLPKLGKASRLTSSVAASPEQGKPLGSLAPFWGADLNELALIGAENPEAGS